MLTLIWKFDGMISVMVFYSPILPNNLHQFRGFRFIFFLLHGLARLHFLPSEFHTYQSGSFEISKTQSHWLKALWRNQQIEMEYNIVWVLLFVFVVFFLDSRFSNFLFFRIHIISVHWLNREIWLKTSPFSVCQRQKKKKWDGKKKWNTSSSIKNEHEINCC